MTLLNYIAKNIKQGEKIKWEVNFWFEKPYKGTGIYLGKEKDSSGWWYLVQRDDYVGMIWGEKFEEKHPSIHIPVGTLNCWWVNKIKKIRGNSITT